MCGTSHLARSLISRADSSCLQVKVGLDWHSHENREWLRRAGPFEISETAVSEIEGQLDFWRQAALAGQEEVAELTERLEESDELIEQLHTMIDDG